MEENKVFYTAADIASDLSIGEGEAAELVNRLQKELKEAGKIVIRGKVPTAWYKQQKESGFMETGQQSERIPLTEKRLLRLKEFCEYSSLGENAARKFAEKTGIKKRIGRKVLFDRELFDRWCDTNAQDEDRPPE